MIHGEFSLFSPGASECMVLYVKTEDAAVLCK